MTRPTPPDSGASGGIPALADERTALLRRVDRAGASLRRGRLVAVTDGKTVHLCLAAETAEAEDIALLKQRATANPVVALTAKRAAVLHIRPTGEDVLTIPYAAHFNTRLIRSLADPTHDRDNPVRGPFIAEAPPVAPAIAAGVRLAKLTQLLPTIIAAPANQDALPDDIAVVSVSDVEVYDDVAALSLHPVSSARVPLEVRRMPACWRSGRRMAASSIWPL